MCIDCISYHPEYMCLQFRVDKVLGWALTEYGDSLQSLVNTPSLNNKLFNVHSSVSDIVTKEVSIILYIIQSLIAMIWRLTACG